MTDNKGMGVAAGDLGASPQVPAPFDPGHTPLPWFQSHRQTGPESWCTEVYDVEGDTIATLAWYPVQTAQGITTSRGANAAFIVLACNLHHEMKEALEGDDPEMPECIRPLSWLKTLIDDCHHRGPAPDNDDPSAYWECLREVEQLHDKALAVLAKLQGA